MALPIHLSDTYWETLHPPVLEAGTYAVDPEPYGPPWRPWEEVGAQEAAARGVFAAVGALSDGPPDTVLLAPGDMRGTGLIPERAEGYCMGINGSGGPNLACLGCGCRSVHGSTTAGSGRWSDSSRRRSYGCPARRSGLSWTGQT